MTPSLLAALEGATGADRELDGQIALMFGLMPSDARYATENVYGPCEPHWCRGGFGDYVFYDPDPYTASIDAIVGLIEVRLPDRDWSVRTRSKHPYQGIHKAEGTIWGADKLRDSLGASSGFAPTPALALCQAFVKAMEAMG